MSADRVQHLRGKEDVKDDICNDYTKIDFDFAKPGDVIIAQSNLSVAWTHKYYSIRLGDVFIVTKEYERIAIKHGKMHFLHPQAGLVFILASEWHFIVYRDLST